MPKSSADFKKKTAKVGKKVKRGIVTEIKVQSKHIHIPLQSQITAASPSDERGTLEKFYKQLNHYSGSVRVQALTQLGQFVQESPNAESFITLIVPKSLELLFDVDSDTRKGLLALMGIILPNFKSKTFSPIISIIITYTCSGLTSLDKSVKKDALKLLNILTETHKDLVLPYAGKLIANVSSLLADSTVNAASLKSETQTKQVNQNSNSSSKKNPVPQKKINEGEMNSILLLLHILNSLLSENSIVAQEKDISYGFLSVASGASKKCCPNIALSPRLNSFQRVGSELEVSKWDSLRTRDDLAGLLGSSFADKMYILWLDISSDINITSASTRLLNSIAEVLVSLHLKQGVNQMMANNGDDSFSKLCLLIFNGFPYSQSFALDNVNESDVLVFHAVRQLDLTVCEMAYVFNAEYKTFNRNTDRIKMALETTSINGIDFLLNLLNSQSNEKQFFQNEKAMLQLWKCADLIISDENVSNEVFLRILGGIFEIVNNLNQSVENKKFEVTFHVTIRPIILCICKICMSDEILSSGMDGYTMLVKIISICPQLLGRSVQLLNNKYLVETLLKSMFMLFNRLPRDSDTDMEEDNNVMLLCQCVIGLFENKITPTLTKNRTTDKKGMKITKQNEYVSFFSQCSSKHKCLILDMYAIFPSCALLNLSSLILKSISRHFFVEREEQFLEQKYFIRLLYERRFDMELSDFLDITSTLIFKLVSCRGQKTASKDDLIQYGLESCSQNWLGQEIANVMYFVTKSHTPIKAMGFIVDELQDIVENNVDKETGDDMWLSQYLFHNTLLSICIKLLSPLQDADTLYSADEKLCMKNISCLLVRSIKRNSEIVFDLGEDYTNRKVKSKLLVRNIEALMKKDVLQAYIEELKAQWDSFTCEIEDNGLKLLQGMLMIVGHDDFYPLLSMYNSELLSLVQAFQSSLDKRTGTFQQSKSLIAVILEKIVY